MTQGKQVILPDGTIARYLFTQAGIGIHVLVLGRVCIVQYAHSINR